MDAFIGTILPWAVSYAPQGWHMCDGSILQVTQYQALFALIGYTYGGNGSSTFGIPDLQCRFPLGAGAGAGLTARTLGQKAGIQVLDMTNLPAHTHSATFVGTGGGGAGSSSLQGSSAQANSASPSGNYITNAYYPGGTDASGGSTLPPVVCDSFVTPGSAGTLQNLAGLSGSGGGITGGTVTVGSTGSPTPASSMPPFLVINFIIALEGLYPVRQ